MGKEEEKDRVCLKCGKMFSSTGPGNRICHKCHLSGRDRVLPRLRTSKVMKPREIARDD